jgi:hypothetical protein
MAGWSDFVSTLCSIALLGSVEVSANARTIIMNNEATLCFITKLSEWYDDLWPPNVPRQALAKRSGASRLHAVVGRR